MEKYERKMAPDAILIEIINTLYVKGSDNKAVAIKIFRLYAQFGAFSSAVLEYARGVGLLTPLAKQAELGYEKFYDASISILSYAHHWEFLAQKTNWQVLADAQKWNFLAEKEQWDVLAEHHQWNILAEHKQWDVLAEHHQWNILAEHKQWDVLAKCKQWDVLAKYHQWNLLRDNSRWLELLSAGQFENVPKQIVIGYAFMRCFMK